MTTGTPDNTGPKQGTGRWRPGESGNPRGRPQGARNRATQVAESLLDGQAEALTRKAIDAALAGDAVALRLCLERILPPRRHRPICIDLPSVEAASDIASALAALVDTVARGRITTEDAMSIANLLDTQRRAIETADLERRITQLEASHARS